MNLSDIVERAAAEKRNSNPHLPQPSHPNMPTYAFAFPPVPQPQVKKIKEKEKEKEKGSERRISLWFLYRFMTTQLY